ncbi:MAG: Condensation domain protein [Methanomassiliicoccales archaeon PtaU1.Bin124]|nr:MAG: Condensation domain protein [Methanomassiliicoccales archaeon PtaU1.Bin124]
MSINDTMDGQGRVLVFFEGKVDQDRLGRAVHLTIRANPMLGFRFVDHHRRPYWQKVDEKDWSPYFVASDHSDERLHEFMVRPVDPSGAPQVRVGLFRSTNDIVCIRMDHLAIDGGGAIRYLTELARTYRQLMNEAVPIPTSANVMRPGPRDVLRTAGFLPSIKGLMGLRLPGAEWGLEGSNKDHNEQEFIIRRLEPCDLAAIRSYAKGHEVTVNDVLLASYCRALFEICDPPRGKKLRVEVPTNLRRYLPRDSEGAACNLSAVYFLSIDRKDDEPFEGTLQRVHDDITRQKESRIELGEMLLLELALVPGKFVLEKLEGMADFQIAHPVISNLGTIAPEMVDFGTVPVRDVQFIGPTLYPPNIGLGVSSFGERMTLNINCCSSSVDRHVMEKLMDTIVRELPF